MLLDPQHLEGDPPQKWYYMSWRDTNALGTPNSLRTLYLAQGWAKCLGTQQCWWKTTKILRVIFLHSPIPGCTGLWPDNLAHEPKFESATESALSTGPWNSFVLGHLTIPSSHGAFSELEVIM